MEHNREILRKIKIWVEHYYQFRLNEKYKPKYSDWLDEEKYWSEPVDGIQIRILVDQRVWPEGMPQPIELAILNYPAGGSARLSKTPGVFQVEINGEWYIYKPPQAEETNSINSYGYNNNFQLSENWHRKSDDKPLQLSPGKYTIRLGLSLKPESERTGIAISKTIPFEILKTD